MTAERKKPIATPEHNRLFPVLSVTALVIIIVLGVAFLRGYMVNQMTQERTNQLQETVVQIRANLDVGLDSYWHQVSTMENSLDISSFKDDDELAASISAIEDCFECAEYSCRVALLDTQGFIYTCDGAQGVWADIARLSDGKDQHTFITDSSNIKGTFLAFAQKLGEPRQLKNSGRAITHIILLKDIATLRSYYSTEAYQGNASTYVVRNDGVMAYYDAESDVLGVRNVFKALNSAEYNGNGSFEEVKEQLQAQGVAVADLRIKGTEYLYALASLPDFDLTLMLLIPAENVAINTNAMVTSTIVIMAVFAVVLALMLALSAVALMRARRRSLQVIEEQETNKELTRLKKAAEDALQLAESASKSKSTFLSNMSHDIRTPMNAVIGYATLAEANAGDEEKVREYLGKILSSSNHLLNLINDVLDMSRIESGRISLEESEVSISELLGEIETIVAPQASAKSLELVIDDSGVADDNVRVDKVRLNQVLLNLLSNAIKFTPEGGQVSVRALQEPDAPAGMGLYKLVVKDTGIGMSPEFAARVFEPFERERSSTVSKIQGTGLGMAICKNIIDMMGGTIELVTEQGKGTEYTVTLLLPLQEPRAEAAQDAGEQVRAEGSAESSESRVSMLERFEGKRLLLVEDNELNREIALELLGMYGFVVDTAEDGAVAVQRMEATCAGGAAADEPYDLVLMDVQMPNMNGYEATRRIRALPDEAVARTLVIAMTANAFEEDKKRAFDAGMDAHVAKPIDVAVLFRTLTEHLR
ncbi:MAG: ATP-binding protein [Coriobacteriales bacterium]